MKRDRMGRYSRTFRNLGAGMLRRLHLREFLSITTAITSIFVVVTIVPGAAAAPGKPTCTNLRIGAEGSSASGGTGSIVFLVANSGSSCTLGGSPKVTFWSAQGERIAMSRTNQHTLSLKPVNFALDHNSVASFKVTWTNIPIRTEVRHFATNATVILPRGALARYSEISIGVWTYGNSLGVSPLRLGPTP